MDSVKEFTGRVSPSYVEYEVRDTSPLLVRKACQGLRECHWLHQRQMLEMLEWVCSTDRQFELARKRALDLINGQERAMTNLVKAMFMDKGGENVPAR